MNMTMCPIDIIYLSCCSKTIHLQTCASLVSLFEILGERVRNFNIYVYTDQPEHFQAYPVKCVKISDDLLHQWIGEQKYFFRIKPEVLIYHARTHHNVLVFLDSDTYFTSDPSEILQKISPQCSLMFENETPYLTRRSKHKIKTFLKKFPQLWREDFPCLAEQAPTMYNSGVVGMHPETHHLLPKILAFTDTCAATRFPMHTFEQYAFMLYLSQKTHILELNSCIVHYWNGRFKHKYNVLLIEKFGPHTKKSLSEQIEILRTIRSQLPQCAQRTLLERLQSLFRRIQRSIGKRLCDKC